jgi:DUF4097 and DUF4098 domain-containing protein YvlB
MVKNMKRNKKMWIIIATICIVAGCVIACAAAASVGFRFTQFNTTKFEKTTYTITDSFENINVNAVESDIIFLPSDGDTCEVVCEENEKITHNVSVKNNTLEISRKDLRKWYEHIDVFFGISDFEMQIYLPQGEYEKLHAVSVSGDIVVSDSFTFREAELETTSGNISFESGTGDAWYGKSVSGDISGKNLTGGNVDIKTTSGEIELEASAADSLHIVSTSGDISLEDVVCETDLFIKSTSGEVSLESCDGGEMTIKTVSGDVEGSLRSVKNFITHTTSGDVYVPDSDSSASTCEITTTSGDIHITVDKS